MSEKTKAIVMGCIIIFAFVLSLANIVHMLWQDLV